MENGKYKNISISGKIAVGSTTLYKRLKEVLQPKGWSFFSGGEYMREYAIKHKLIDQYESTHHAATVYSDQVDTEFDAMVAKKLKDENHLAVESDLAGFFSRENSNVLRILLVCDDKLRIDRLVNRENMTIEEAKEHIKKREEENLSKWKRLYGEHNFWDPSYYNLIIDTFKNSPKETLKQVLLALNIPF